MFLYDGIGITGFIVFFHKTIAVIFFSGILAVPIFRVRIKSVVSVSIVFIIVLAAGILTLPGIKTGGLEFFSSAGSSFGEIPLRIDCLSALLILIIKFTSLAWVIYSIVLFLIIFIGTILNLWY
jgi:hypothetical protein